MSTLRDQLLEKAVALLARREHGVAELAAKLRARFPEAGSTELVETLETLQDRGWLDEQCFVDNAVEQYRARGDGPLKIRHKLTGKVEARWRLDEALALPDALWARTAREALIRKYGDARRPRDPKELARRLRFLNGRGFTQAQCWAAFEQE